MRGVLRGTRVAVVLLVLALSVEVPRTASAHGDAPPNALPIPQSGSNWSNMSPTGGPSTRLFNLAMVYDSAADRIIAYGGHAGLPPPPPSNKTWAYDFESNTWSDLAPKTHPTATTLVRAAYDSWAQRTILFGGFYGEIGNGNYSDETWAYDSANNTWTNLQPAIHPSARSRQGTAFDAQSGRTILFGGDTVPFGYSDETWAYDAASNSWTNMTPAVHPSGRRSPGMVYDASADRMILFGGFNGTYGLDDTWAYDFESNTWTNLDPTNPPSARWGFGFAYDSAVDRCILFGGTAGDRSTWAYDFASNSWSTINVDHSPPYNAFLGMDYDRQSARTILFGGSYNETWALTTVPGPPSVPEAFAADPGNGYVNLSWNAPRDDGLSPITGYRIYRATSPGSESLFAELGAVESWTDTNVTNGETHYYQVSAVNENGEGPRSRELAAAPDGTPPVTSARLAGPPGNDGWYVGPVTVELTATDDNSGVRSTSYRIDGGVWTTYASPVTVAGDGNHSVDYYSTDRAGNVETAQTIGFRIDTTSPEATMALSGTVGDEYWFHSTVTAEITATDAMSGVASVLYRLDGGNDWLTYSTPLEVGEGRHVLETYAVDVAGLTSDVVSKSFGVDTQPPYTTALVEGPAGANNWYVGLVTVTLEATDALGATTISYRLDVGSWTDYSGPFVLDAGVHTLEYYAVDASGLSEPVHTKTISIDMAAPTATATFPSPPAAGWYTAPIPVTLSGSDTLSGVASIRYRIDAGEWQVYTGSLVIAADGLHTIEYYATDSAGLNGAHQSFIVNVDTTAPVIENLVPSGLVTTSTITITWTGSDGGSGIDHYEVSVDGGPFASRGLQMYAQLFQLTDGPHTITIRAFDRAGNEVSAEVTVTVDTNPLSASGPYGAMPLYAIGLTAIVIAALLAFLFRRRRRRAA